METWPWWSLIIVWALALGLGAVLWQRFTRVPAAYASYTRGAGGKPRRVVPLWLALVLLFLLILAIWITVAWLGAQGGAPPPVAPPPVPGG